MIGWSDTFMKKWPLEYQMVNKTYLSSNLCDSSDSSDSSDSCYSSDSSDQKSFSAKKKKIMNLKNLICNETQKLKLWWN